MPYDYKLVDAPQKNGLCPKKVFFRALDIHFEEITSHVAKMLFPSRLDLDLRSGDFFPGPFSRIGWIVHRKQGRTQVLCLQIKFDIVSITDCAYDILKWHVLLEIIGRDSKRLV